MSHSLLTFPLTSKRTEGGEKKKKLLPSPPDFYHSISVMEHPSFPIPLLGSHPSSSLSCRPSSGGPGARAPRRGRLGVRDGLHFDLAQLLLPSLHRLLIQVVEDARTQGIALHVHHGGGAVPAGREQAGVTVDATWSHQEADVTAGRGTRRL